MVKKVNGKSKVKIEKGIPIPPDRAELSYILGSLEVGDSVVLDATSSRPNITQYGKILKRRFTTRAVEGGGVRVWRLE